MACQSGRSNLNVPGYRPTPWNGGVPAGAAFGAGRCRFCGRVCNNQGKVNAINAAADEELMRRRQRAFEHESHGPNHVSVNPVGDSLYGARTPADRMVYTSCCDVYSGCGAYDLSSRNPFWPSFAHPRWLGCDQLYGGCQQGPGFRPSPQDLGRCPNPQTF